ncbi:MAG TPA: tRNA uracil 4-sulfurtransferase ThiI [Vicinamibacterales bacterium]|nr:tRNA uracil 4-sulfurtransferase ThiI [Vicinamibacterales bacterium]
MSSVIVHYGELALKGRNRPWFVSSLVRSIRILLGGLGVREVRHVMGRIEIRLGPESDWEEVRTRLSRLPGIGNFSHAVPVPADLEAIASYVERMVAGRTAKSFRILARRADKRFPFESPDIEREVGRRVQAVTGWPVNLSKPETVIRIEVLTRDAYCYFDKEPGAGGLPVGTSGRVMCLLSGGIDSPVAAWRLIRRGCRAHFVHFHSYPILTRTSQDKAREIVRRLTRHQLKSRLLLVPFGAVQQRVVVTVPPPLRVVIYRRLMVRIAERLARDAGIPALVTGDVVGQVASQTIDNLTVVESAATLPILRPLIGLDKEEITTEARRLETYDVSIIPDEDCCTLFTPRFPATRTTRAAAEAAERNLDVAGLVDAAIAGVAIEDFGFPVLRLAVPQGSISAGDQK